MEHTKSYHLKCYQEKFPGPLPHFLSKSHPASEDAICDICNHPIKPDETIVDDPRVRGS